MEKTSSDNNEQIMDQTLFINLVMQYEQAAMIFMGKIANPVNNKLERNLEMARIQIDLLAMIERKTKGNLNKDEERILRTTLTNLRMNYVEEASKKEEKTEERENEQSSEDDSVKNSATE